MTPVSLALATWAATHYTPMQLALFKQWAAEHGFYGGVPVYQRMPGIAFACMLVYWLQQVSQYRGWLGPPRGCPPQPTPPT